MKLIRSVLASVLLLPTLALAQPYTEQQEQDRLISLGMTPELAVELTAYVNGDGILSILLPNNVYLKARNAADDADLDLLKADATDDTVLNADTGDIIKLSIAGTSEVQIDNDSLTFTGAAASIVGGATSIKLGSAGSTIIDPQNDAQRLITFSATSDTAITQKFGDGGTTASQNFAITASTADGDDDSVLDLSGGGAFAADGTRGAGIRLGGDQANNDVVIVAGAANNGDVVLIAPASNGTVNVQTAGSLKWTFGTTGTLIGAGTADAGWTPKAGANTACNTTCVAPCVFGIDSAAPQTWLLCTDATADMCLCAGAS